MATRKISFEKGEFYHLYNRGNSKQEIFHNDNDYNHFIFLLLILNNQKNIELRNIQVSKYIHNPDIEPLVSIGAYVLMPNHFHILITEKIEGGISKFMQKLSTAYVMYYNKKYKRTGSLFEGKFKSQHLNTDKYLKYIFSYIHLNPIKLIDKHWKEKGILNKKVVIDYINKYTYSSYLDYIGTKRIQNSILNTKDFPDYFPTKNSFNVEMSDWLSYGDFE
jgi:putative transposase